MFTGRSRIYRWIGFVIAGGCLLQATGCDLFLQTVQTGLLGAIAGGMYFLARNV
ncbi:MAG: hypothetical protein GXY44_02270 [Phycisphaerales bacterium]|nr:hypothetical protein [Phycisphaerales bacterium]